MKTLPFPGNLETAFYGEQTTWLNTTGESVSFITWERTSWFEFCASFVKWFLHPICQQLLADMIINLLLFEGDSCWFSCFFFLCPLLLYILKVAWCSYFSSSKSADSEVHPHPEGKAEFWFLHLKSGVAELQKVQRRTWK